MRMNAVDRRASERGNALLYVFIAIAVLAMLTFAVSDSNDFTENIADYAADDEQIARMMTYSGTLGSAVSQMIAGGLRAETVYSTLSLQAPGQAGYETAPHNLKLYHPMGGGMNYMTATGATTSSNTVATTFRVNPASIVTGVGSTDITVGDVLFTAVITSRKACQRINFLLTGASSMPVLATASYTSLFVTGSTVTISAANCPNCVNRGAACVSNTADTAWGFYSTLLPG
jgi:hypothetical protein